MKRDFLKQLGRGLLAAALTCSGAAMAQDYPNKPIRIVVPYGAGSSPDVLARLPLNPAANDLAFRAAFPYLAAPQGSPPLAATTGTNFNFRTDSVQSAYVRVDRMGMPAVSTALIGSAMKNAYNDANPADDADGDFVPELSAQLTGLTNALADELV